MLCIRVHVGFNIRLPLISGFNGDFSAFFTLLALFSAGS
jgi:hypothetical protein